MKDDSESERFIDNRARNVLQELALLRARREQLTALILAVEEFVKTEPVIEICLFAESIERKRKGKPR